MNANAARHPSLESAFAAPARGSSLSGILPPRAEAPTPAPPAEAAPAAPVASAGRATAGRTGKRATAARVRAGTRNVAAYLPPLTLRAAGEWTRTNDATYADLLVKAFDEVDEADLRASFVPRAQVSPAGMPRRSVVPHGATGIQRQFRLNDDQLAWLDQQVVELGAPSRSALIAAAVGLLLGTHQE